jgi:phage nucleotide-binding protein
MKIMSIHEAVKRNTDSVSFLIYGDSGVGKTTMGLGMPGKQLWITSENGALSLNKFLTGKEQHQFAVLESVPDLIYIVKYLKGEVKDEVLGDCNNYDSIIIDSLTECAEMLLEEEKEKSKDGRQAYGKAQERTMSLLRFFRDLNKHTLIICRQESVSDDGSLVKRPKLIGQAINSDIAYHIDEIFALCVKMNEDKSIKRYLRTSHDGEYVTKDRSGALDLYEKPDLSAIIEKISSSNKQTATPTKEK